MIRYRAGYKYQLAETFRIRTPIRPAAAIKHDYFSLGRSGLLTIRRGYAWDGMTDPGIDTRETMAPSLVHDVFCQAMRAGLLDFGRWQDEVNLFFRDHLKACGVTALRAWWCWRAVEFANCGHPDQGESNPLQEAP